MVKNPLQASLGIIDDVPELSKIDAGRFGLDPGHSEPVEGAAPSGRVGRPAPVVEGARGESAAPAGFRPLRILLAEDNFVNQRLACRLLEKRGHSVTVVGNGGEALERLEQETFDLVLMDVQMPEMDGVEAAEAIRAREQETGLHIPIVALTAHAMKGDRERYLASGMDGYVPKPIRQQDLWKVIESFPSRPISLPPKVTSAQPALAGSARQPTPESEALVGPPPLDREAALEKVGGDASLLGELACLFLGNWESMLAKVREAAACGDALALERAAHGLKGSVGNFAADEVYQAALDVEYYARQGLLASAAEACERLEQAMVRLRPSVEALLETVTA